MTKTIHYQDNPNNFFLQCYPSTDQVLSSSNLENKPKKLSAFDCKYQISLEKRSRNIPRLINQLISMPKIQAAGKFLSELISYLSGKNIIALSDISQKLASEVTA